MDKQKLIDLLRKWEKESDHVDAKMRYLIGSKWYSSLSDAERKQYCVLQAEYTGIRTCANELANLLEVEQQHGRRN